MDVDVDVVEDDDNHDVAAAATAGLMDVDKRAPRHPAARNTLAGPKRRRTAGKEEHVRDKRLPPPLPDVESQHNAQADANDANKANDAGCTSMRPPPPPPALPRICIRIPVPRSSSRMQTGRKGEEPSSSTPAPDDAFGHSSASGSEREQDQSDTPDEEDDSEDESEEDQGASSTSDECHHTSKSFKSKPKPKSRTKPKTRTKTKTTKTGTKIKHPKPPKLLKPKPETYNQPWSVEEQNLLEQLLDEVDDGEKCRWVSLASLFLSLFRIFFFCFLVCLILCSFLSFVFVAPPDSKTPKSVPTRTDSHPSQGIIRWCGRRHETPSISPSPSFHCLHLCMSNHEFLIITPNESLPKKS